MWGPTTLVRRAAAAAALALSATAVAACGSDEPDLVAGKQQFVQKCGACHVLNRAGTRGVVGPNLDEAFQQGLSTGMGRNGIEGTIHDWILRPNPGSPMPAKLVTGDDAEDVAAYVARSVSRGGKDTGLLATAVPAAGGGEPIAAEAGVLDVPADPSGQLAYASKEATAEAGRLTVSSTNEASIPHNIVIDGKGTGKVVQGGAVSQFEADFEPGEYQFYCSVQGHRQAGMEGTLTVE
jgi:plastocyanin